MQRIYQRNPRFQRPIACQSCGAVQHFTVFNQHDGRRNFHAPLLRPCTVVIVYGGEGVALLLQIGANIVIAARAQCHAQHGRAAIVQALDNGRGVFANAAPCAPDIQQQSLILAGGLQRGGKRRGIGRAWHNRQRGLGSLNWQLGRTQRIHGKADGKQQQQHLCGLLCPSNNFFSHGLIKM